MRNPVLNSRHIHTGESAELFEIVAQWLTQGRQVCIATVVNIWGSCQTKVGNQIIVDHRGNFAGSVSGEDEEVDAEVILQCLDSLTKKQHTYLELDVGYGPHCNSKIRIYIQPMDGGFVTI